MPINRGVRNMLFATFIFAIMNVCVKFLRHIPAVEIIFFRCVISLFLTLAILKARKLKVWGNHKTLLILRGSVGSAALILFFITLQNMPLAGAVTIHFLSPIFTTILGIFIVKERVSFWQWLFFLLSFIGVYLIYGFDERMSSIYVIMGLLAAFFSGIAYNIIRKLNISEHPLVIVLYFPLVATPVTAIFSLFDWVQPQGWDWVLLMMVGLLTQMAQYLMTTAYQSEDLSKVAPLNYLGILYALGFGFLFFGEVYPYLAFLGIVLVLCGVLLNLYFKSRMDKAVAMEKNHSDI